MIRVATEDDIPRIAEIHAHAWVEAYSHIISPEILEGVTVESRTTTWNQWFHKTEQILHVYEKDSHIVGFTRIAPPAESRSELTTYVELTHLYQDPIELGSGTGHRLFENAVKFVKQAGKDGMFLWTLERNARARRFYEEHGMHSDGPRKDEPAWLGEGVYEIRYILPFKRESLPLAY